MTSGIIEILLDDATVTDLVGLNRRADKVKIYPTRAPQGETEPYIVVAKVSNNVSTSLTKDLSSLLDYPRYNVACYAKIFRETEILFEAVRAALDNKQSITDAGAVFTRIWLSNDFDAYDDTAQVYCHVAVFDAELKRNEPT